jgi:hypothetical protein
MQLNLTLAFGGLMGAWSNGYDMPGSSLWITANSSGPYGPSFTQAWVILE